MLLGVQRPWTWCIWHTFRQVYLWSICHILDSFFVQTYAPPETCLFARFPLSSGGAALTGQLFRRLLVVRRRETSSCGLTQMQQAPSLALAACSAVLQGFKGMCQRIPCMHEIGYIYIDYQRSKSCGLKKYCPVSSVIYLCTFAEILVKQLVHTFGVLAPSREDLWCLPQFSFVEVSCNLKLASWNDLWNHSWNHLSACCWG